MRQLKRSSPSQPGQTQDVSPGPTYPHPPIPRAVGHSISKYDDFKAFKQRILVATDLFGRGIDIERVNIVINYDFPSSRESKSESKSEASDQYIHRVGRAGRFGTKGLAISFIADQDDADQLAAVQSRFEVDVPLIPDQIDINSYMS